jgi:hypothetical protein
VFEPFMIAGAAGVALVAARLWMGKGGALAAVAFFLVVRSGISLIVGPVFGEITPTFPLYLGSAIVIELLALALPLARRPLLFGAVGGLAIGTVGHLTEHGWTQLTQTLSWGSDIAVEGTLMAVVGGVSGGLLGALLATGLRRRLPRPGVSRPVFVACLLALGVAVANGLVATVPDDVEATFVFEDVQADPRIGHVGVQLTPADAVDDPSWVQITAWQGDGLVVTNLEETGPGQYRTTEPVPLHGTWKTLLRIHDGRELYAMPIWMPEDPVIEAEEVPAEQGVTRAAIPEIEILQRELKDDAPGWLWGVSNLVVLLCTLAIVTAIAWGVGRYSRRGSAGEVYPDRPVEAPQPEAAQQ